MWAESGLVSGFGCVLRGRVDNRTPPRSTYSVDDCVVQYVGIVLHCTSPIIIMHWSRAAVTSEERIAFTRAASSALSEMPALDVFCCK